MRRNHWVWANVEANHSENNSDAVIYDFFQAQSSDPSTDDIVFFRSIVDISKIMFDLARVQQQADASSCGLFSIAFAIDIAHYNRDPRHSTYDMKKMRQHLVSGGLVSII